MKLDHIQLAMPKGAEDAARAFFVGVLGMIEEEKPRPLQGRGGCWFRHGSTVIHLGVDPKFRSQKKAHPAFIVRDLDEYASRIANAGHEVAWDDALQDRRRFYTTDSFGNRIEFVADGDGFAQRGKLAEGERMKSGAVRTSIEQLKQLAQTWNELYAARRFEEMKNLATEDVGIANAKTSTDPSGMIFGRQAYYDGIVGAYRGSTGKERNLLVMRYEGWEYIPLGNGNAFYTIGLYTLQPNVVGVNCWLLRRASAAARWRIFRVINN